MRHKTKLIALSGITAVSLFAYVGGGYHESTPPTQTLKPVTATDAHYIDRDALITALTDTPELVGLTGTAEKTIGYSDAKWFGDKAYELTVKGTFKIGVATEDLEVTTAGNVVTIRFPQPKLLTTDFPFDIADIRKDVGVFRDDLTETELQALYGKAREGAVDDIKRNRQAFEQAEDSVERSIERIIGMVTDYSEAGNTITVKFEEVTE